MLDDLLKSISPDTLAHVIKSNPVIVMATMHKFKAYRSFGLALTNEQQLTLSNNLGKLNDFFKSEEGKEAIGIIAEEFSEFVNKK